MLEITTEENEVVYEIHSCSSPLVNKSLFFCEIVQSFFLLFVYVFRPEVKCSVFWSAASDVSDLCILFCELVHGWLCCVYAYTRNTGLIRGWVPWEIFPHEFVVLAWLLSGVERQPDVRGGIPV